MRAPGAVEDTFGPDGGTVVAAYRAEQSSRDAASQLETRQRQGPALVDRAVDGRARGGAAYERGRVYTSSSSRVRWRWSLRDLESTRAEAGARAERRREGLVQAAQTVPPSSPILSAQRIATSISLYALPPRPSYVHPGCARPERCRTLSALADEPPSRLVVQSSPIAT